MAFRDDRDAQLARAEALDRENERLREELARREAGAADAVREAEARGRADGASSAETDAAPLEEENAQLRAKLARARGPGLGRRVASRIAALRLAEPPAETGFWRAADQAWRLYLPMLAGLTLPAASLGGRTAWATLLFAVGAPALAALVLAGAWWLRRRRPVVAGAIAGAALGPACSLALAAPLSSGTGLRLEGVGAIAIAIVLMLVTRTLRFRDLRFPWFILAPLRLMPLPFQLMSWFGFGHLGARLVDPAVMND